MKKRIKSGRSCRLCSTKTSPFRYLYPYPGEDEFTGVYVCLSCFSEARQQQIDAGIFIPLGKEVCNERK